MKIILHRASLLSVFLVQVVSPALSAATCPADQLVFRDRERNLTFGAERVAVQHKYLCNGKMVEASSMGPNRQNCRGPFGETIIEGYLSGQKVYAVYTAIPASPCCSWDSYSANTSIAKKVKRWLPSGQGPKIELGSAWFTIEGDETNPVNGPLGGGKFVPTSCRRP